MMQGRNAVLLSSFFKMNEFECNGGRNDSTEPGICTCGGAVIIDSLFFERLVYLRGYLNRSIRITRGYSCPAYNLHLGGAEHSKHLRGMAVDWDVYSSGFTENEAALYVLETKLFTGIGIYGRSYRDGQTGDIVLVRGYKNLRGMIHIEYDMQEDSRPGREHGIMGPTKLFRKWGDWHNEQERCI